MERYTSASDRHFKDSLFFAVCLLSSLLCTLSFAGLIDRVVAFVDDRAITSSELEETFEKTRRVRPDISEEEVLNTMINRMLMLNEAKRLKLEAKTDDELLNEYIEMKVKAFIRVSEDEIEEFYNRNISEFRGSSYEAVRDKIEEYLIEQEVNRLLKRHIEELRAKAYVKILWPTGGTSGR